MKRKDNNTYNFIKLNRNIFKKIKSKKILKEIISIIAKFGFFLNIKVI